MAGVVLKPLKGAQQDGVTGFVKGIQKGVLGVVTSTAGGALQFASKGVQGVSTAFKQVGHTLTGDFSVDRMRLARAASSDGILRCYDPETAFGQHVLRLGMQVGTRTLGRVALWNPLHRSRVNSGQQFQLGSP